MAVNSDLIVHNFYTAITRAFKEGRIDRSAGDNFVPASVDPATGVQSKDVSISPETAVSARLYLPGNATPGEKLPLVVYFHGGGFILESAFSPLYHKHLNMLVAEAKVVAVSVNYRLAPEHPLPAAYDDSWAASGPAHDDWIQNYADLDRVFLGGDSAGSNIAITWPFGSGWKTLFLNCAFIKSGAKVLARQLGVSRIRAQLGIGRTRGSIRVWTESLGFGLQKFVQENDGSLAISQFQIQENLKIFYLKV